MSDNTKWSFCDNHHEYSEYYSEVFGRTVCYQCDPLSENNAHRPAVAALLRKIGERRIFNQSPYRGHNQKENIP